MRQEGVIEGALLVKHQESRYKNNRNFKNQLFIHLAAIVRRKVIHNTSVGEDLTPSTPNAINLDMKL